MCRPSDFPPYDEDAEEMHLALVYASEQDAGGDPVSEEQPEPSPLGQECD